MSKLPPVEKLPLALRKNVRDEWDNKKSAVEKDLSDVLGTPWTIEVNPNQIYAYAEDGYAKECLGNCIYDYFTAATRRLKEFSDHVGAEGLNDLNTICHAHTLTLDLDSSQRFAYCGTDVHAGSLRLLFAPGRLGTNIDDAASREVLTAALSGAAAAGSDSDSGPSFAARADIRREYEAQIEGTRARIGALLGRPEVRLEPGFAGTWAALSSAKDEVRDDWEGLLGAFTRLYFEGLARQLEGQGFGSDELLREGLNEALTTGTIAFRIVGSLGDGELYNEVVVEDGVLYLQCTAKTWGVNIDDAAEKLVDKL
ncbi:hypothetical protein F4775DRAFT_602901 [Biscogniauxia sp. FL1348]|nr:hypothetical protein F4775DRAFT_602901 [Biscogniauxia sp. FL1348]